MVISAVVLMWASTAAAASNDMVKAMDPGTTWTVEKTTRLNHLTIAGGVIQAPEGYSLTMTVDGIETAIKPGAYRGDIVMTPTKIIRKEDPGHDLVFHLRTGIYLENGEFVPEKSVAAAVNGGAITGTAVSDVNITSVGEEFNGIIATGDEKVSYMISDPVISLTGDGADDFAGVGAAIMSDGAAVVTLNNASIHTNGCARSAIFVGGTSAMHVYDSTIEVGSPALPEDYKDVWTEGGKRFFRVPFMLGLSGTCRATNIVDKVKETTYYNTTIRAQGWGALSIDGGDNTQLTVTKSIIETVESGYGAYAIGGSVDKFSNCIFNVADMALIGAGGDGIFTDGTIVNSRRFGVMLHGAGDITIDKGSMFNTRSTALQIKGCGSNIVADNAELKAGNGIIIQTMPNDDPMSRAAASRAAEGGGGAPTEEAFAEADGGMPQAPRSNDVNAVFSNMTLEGDMVNGNTESGALTVSLKNATLTGAVTTATVDFALGPDGEEITMQTPHLYQLIGEVKNSYCETGNAHGAEVSVDADSKWIVDKTSYLTRLDIAKKGTVKAPEGYSIVMTVDGKETRLKKGSYEGNIVLEVVKGA
jgi:hypothetical protein